MKILLCLLSLFFATVSCFCQTNNLPEKMVKKMTKSVKIEVDEFSGKKTVLTKGGSLANRIANKGRNFDVNFEISSEGITGNTLFYNLGIRDSNADFKATVLHFKIDGKIYDIIPSLSDYTPFYYDYITHVAGIVDGDVYDIFMKMVSAHTVEIRMEGIGSKVDVRLTPEEIKNIHNVIVYYEYLKSQK